jgi:signal transduction histidine kinase
MDTSRLQGLVFDAVRDPLIVVDETGDVHAANAAAVRLFGLAENAGMTTIMGRLVLDTGVFRGFVQHGLSAIGIAVPDRAGRPTGILVDVEPVRGPGDRKLSVLHFHAPAQRLARELWTDETVAAVAHELRNPLTSMRNALDLLASGAPGALTDAQRRFVCALQRATLRLARMVDGYLDLTRDLTGVLHVQREPIDVRACIVSVINDYVALNPAVERRIDCEIATEVDTACLDRDRIEQVLVNLIANAIRFTPNGERVTVRVGVAGREAMDDDTRLLPWDLLGDPRLLRVDVVDRGLGMASTTLAHIFDRYHETGEGGGAHLGLHISRALVEAHDGWLRAESRLGEGTTVSFVVPADRRTATSVARARAATTAMARLRAAKRSTSVLVLGKPDGEDWADIARTWACPPALNPARGEAFADASLWTIRRDLALAVIPAESEADIAGVVGPWVQRCEEGAWSMAGYALGAARVADGASIAAALSRAAARMARSLASLSILEARAVDLDWLVAGVRAGTEEQS